ncbi:MAG TPA: DMT family transporter [Thermoanaerobacterales bacterium]|nr:DMT family transporter [Thermoanaerobacterales bacterium]
MRYNLKKSLLADGALLLITMTWGLNFVVMKNALIKITPYLYLGIRFMLASLILALIFNRQLRKLSKEELRGGLIIGLCVFLGFITQTVGLLYTTPGKSGFITSTYVVLVPFLAFFLTKEFPGWFQVLGAAVTFLGLGIISINEDFTINFGDALTLVCAVAFALQIIYTEQYVKKSNPINIAILQTGVTGFLTLVIGLWLEPLPETIDPAIWTAILYAVIFCTAGAFVIQNIAQKYTSSTHAAVIMGMESVFAGLFSFIFWGEIISLRTLIGFALIFGGVLITELMPSADLRVKSRTLDEQAELNQEI